MARRALLFVASLLTVPCTVVVAAGSAYAQGDPPITDSEDAAAPRFGRRGQVAISGAFSLDTGRTSYTDSDQTSFGLEVSPSAHLFVAENVSIGASIYTRYRELSIPLGGGEDIDESAFAVGISATIGSNLPAGDRVSFWPRLSIGVWTEKLNAPQISGFSVNRNGQYWRYGDLRETQVGTSLWIPVLYHPAPHFFIGFGPQASVDLWHSVEDVTNRRIFFGASSLVGGWL